MPPQMPIISGGKAKTFLEQIYDKLNGLYGAGESEIFQMENPARLIEKGTYNYVGSDTIDAQQMKPQTVVDAEFRLTDDMFSISKFVGGPKGSRVSTQYSQIINQLVPCSEADSSMAKLLVPDQEKICQWLDEEVADWDPPDIDLLQAIPHEYADAKPRALETAGVNSNMTFMEPTKAMVVHEGNVVDKKEIMSAIRKVPRIDLYQKLVNAYEAQRFRWAEFKRRTRPGENATPRAIDDYNRMLAFYAPIVDAQLESLWTMLLVRGQYHRVRRYIGFVDIESASESVQIAKETLRASFMRSIDDTQDVFPVYLQPSNWATYLTTKFQPEDLLSNESVVRDRLFDKEKQRSLLMMKLNALKGGQQDVAALEEKETSARAAYLNAQKEMVEGYSDTSVQLIDMYFTAVTRQATNKIDALDKLMSEQDLNSALKVASQPPLTSTEFDRLKQAQQNCLKRQHALQTSSEALARASLAAASSRGSESSTMISELTLQIEEMTIDINYLKQSFAACKNPMGVSIKLLGSDNEIIPALESSSESNAAAVAPSVQIPRQEEGASVWQEVVITMEKNEAMAQTANSSSVSQSHWNTSFFVGSGSGSESSQAGSQSKVRTASNTNLQIGFRTMKVVINRPWMNAGILNQTQEFYHANGAKIAEDDARAVKQALDATNQSSPLANDNALTKVLERTEQSLLPAWSVAFLVAKDVHIIMDGSSDFDQSETADLQKRLDSGGGFLCFSTSKSEASGEHRTAAGVSHEKNRLSIKIPAPQIIGWISHLCPKDQCQQKYRKLDDTEFKQLTHAQTGGATGSQAPQQGALPPARDQPPVIAQSRSVTAAA